MTGSLNDRMRDGDVASRDRMTAFDTLPGIVNGQIGPLNPF